MPGVCQGEACGAKAAMLLTFFAFRDSSGSLYGVKLIPTASIPPYVPTMGLGGIFLPTRGTLCGPQGITVRSEAHGGTQAVRRSVKSPGFRGYTAGRFRRSPPET